MTNGFEFGVGLLNFCLLFFILKAILIKPLQNVAAEREAKARKSMAEAESILDQARKGLEKYTKLYEQLEEQKAAIAASAQRDAQAERKRIADIAENEAKATISRAAGEASSEHAGAVAQIREQIATATVAYTQSILESSLDDEARQNMIENFLTKVGAKRA